jgi:hydrogenase maturation protein HypF
MERRSIVIRGTVQGVGFRPFVFGLATKLQLGGFVKNRGGTVEVEVEGDIDQLDQFLNHVVADAPPLARITDLTWNREPPLGDRQFRIADSDLCTTGEIVIAPDTATCDDCLAELFDPHDRRFGYPFLNCTNCGPRLTIVTGAPYDRARTTMAGFVMCPACRAEYEDPTNRRFHAQPTACPVCGPKLTLLDERGNVVETDSPLRTFVEAIRNGKIGAMKGLGGFHLICDATNLKPVDELRIRKHRDEKPFAVMVADLSSANCLVEIDPAEQALLTSPRRPIVLLTKQHQLNGTSPLNLRVTSHLVESNLHLAPGVAPNNPRLGIMLPYTPLHHLLLRGMEGVPLVMTSGNRSDEPIAYENADAVASLQGIADLFLVHDRPIYVRCDDSVTRVMDGKESPVRRSRGDAPQPIALPLACPMPILAVGGQLKGTFALGTGKQAVVSHHLGDLDHLKAFQAFERDTELYQNLFQISPACIAHDLHPDFASTRYAVVRAAKQGIRRFQVQHHHAHMASCMAEHGLNEPVIGVTFDGTGLGLDGNIWGGEFLVGDYKTFKRAAHLRYVAMPGGDRAVREPWRMAVAYLLDAESHCAAFELRITESSIKLMRTMIASKINAPLTSSAGRLFDAVASILGVRDQVSYEGQAAMQLEWAADLSDGSAGYPFETSVGRTADDDPIIIDTRPTIAAICRDANLGKSVRFIAGQFHSTVATMIARVSVELRKRSGLNAVVLSGGTFMNARLTKDAIKLLENEGFRVFRHQVVPPNDGGLSLGQLAVAAAQSGV